MRCSVLSSRGHGLAACLLLLAAAAGLGCGAHRFEPFHDEALGSSPARWAAPGLPLADLAANVEKSVVRIRIDCAGKKKLARSAFVVKRSAGRAYLMTAWSVLYPGAAQCQIERLRLSGAGITPMELDARAGLPDLLEVRGSQAAGLALFLLAGQPDGPTLALGQLAGPAESRAELVAADAVGGPVVMAATGQAVGVVTELLEQPAGAGGPRRYRMAPLRALASELAEHADLALAEQLAPYGLDPLTSVPPTRPEETAIHNRLARRSPPPFVLLTGGAGAGLSTLGNKLAWEGLFSGQFPDGVLRLSVRGRPTDEVLGELYEVVLHRPPPPALPATVSTLASVLAGRRILVVLEDLRFDSDRLPVELLQALAATPVLATSRKLYKGARVQAVELEPLLPELAHKAVRATLSAPASRALGDADIDLLCQRLGYDGLALTLAAGMLSRSRRSVASFLEAWQAQQPAGAREASPDRALGALLDLIFADLDRGERQVLIGIGLLAEAPVSADLLAALLDEDAASVAAAMDRLVELHVLERPAQSNKVSAHPLIYAWAQKKAEKSWFRDRKRDRLVRWFLLAARKLPQERWGLSLASQLQACQEWAARDQQPDAVYALAEAWDRRLRESGPWSLWDRLWRSAVEAMLRSGDRKSLMLALRRLARTREQAGYGRGAEPLYRESLKIARDLRDERAIIETLNELGASEGAGKDAVLLLKTSLEQAQLFGDLALLAATYKQLGAAHAAGSDFASAEAALTKSLSSYERLLDDRGRLEVMQELYSVSLSRKDAAAAQRWLVRRVEVCERLREPRCAVPSHLSIARLADERGDTAEARRHFDAALFAARTAEDPGMAAAILEELARRADRTGSIAQAFALWQQAAASADKSSDLKLQLGVFALGADLAYRLRDLPLADQELDRALGLCARLGDRQGLLSLVVRFDALRWSRTPISRQLARLEDAREQAARQRSDELVAFLDLALGRLYRLAGEPEAAEQQITKSAERFERQKHSYGLALVLASQASLAVSRGVRGSSHAGFARALALCEKSGDESRPACLKAVTDDAREAQRWAVARRASDRRLALVRRAAPRLRSTELASAVEESAELLLLRGDRAAGQRRYQEALGLWQKLAADTAVARVLERMARLAWDRGDGSLAGQWLAEALVLGASLDHGGETWARIRLLQAEMAWQRRQRAQARVYAAEAAALFDRLHAPEFAAAHALLKRI